jgi:undecaprenyl-diphosphatase
MLIHAFKEIAELACLAVALYLVAALASHRIEAWRDAFRRRRLRILTACAALVVLVQVVEEVWEHDSDALDEALLRAIRGAMPAALDGFFHAITTTASAAFLVPVVCIGTGVLLARGRTRAALQLGATTVFAGAATYLAKMAFARPRPALWDTQWYWGSSFPSGHTLAAAAIGTCLCLLVAHARLATRAAVVVTAGCWIALVGLSRLVLGVHWPTDVVAAASAGLLVAVAVHWALWRWWPRKTKGPADAVR